MLQKTIATPFRFYVVSNNSVFSRLSTLCKSRSNRLVTYQELELGVRGMQ